MKRREDQKAATVAKHEAEKQVKDLEQEKKKREKDAKCLAEVEVKQRKAAVTKPAAKHT